MLRSIANTIARHSTEHKRVLGGLYSIAHGSQSGTGRFNAQLQKDLSGYYTPRSTAPVFSDDLLFLASTRRIPPGTKSTTLSPSLPIMSKRLCHSSPVAWKSSSSLARGNMFFNSHIDRNAAKTNLRQQLQQQQQRQQRRGMAGTSLQRFTGRFSVDSPNKIVYPFVAINIVVFATWQYAEGKAQRFRDGRLFYFMFQNFANSAQNLREGRVWTLVTSAFSHKDWFHVLLNMVVLLSFGDPVWRMLGTRKFLAVYLGSAIASSLSSIGYNAYMEPYLRKIQNKTNSRPIHYSLGASGGIMGITTAFACVHPFSQYSLFFVINMPAIALIGLFGAYEMYNVLTATTGRFDSASHLGGGLFGAGYYFVKLRPLIRKMGRR
ncbi:hypothetical protein BGZ65_004290 [Modicella reniformis]|uniref:Peptidase S54 rhomboid domain-containing protein n=1 Tax=Modicella reniformis TaxID=1440133 RepID=A0A9P6LSG5_9FUNG|nr:hypothetical protein BGZ65_004290 [Modicella reniformis]